MDADDVCPRGGAGMSEQDADTVPGLDALLAEADALCEAATEGPWKWRRNAFEDDPADKYVDHGWNGHGPDLETEVGEEYLCPHYCVWKDDNGVEHRGQGPENPHTHLRAEPIITSWGHDAWGLYVCRSNAEFIARSRTLIPELCEALRRLREEG